MLRDMESIIRKLCVQKDAEKRYMKKLGDD